nr:branched-chain amino acid ABC transporter permease [Chthonobacter albigriseus]
MPVSAVYAFLAVAYALVYGLVNRINLAFGELAVMGAYATVAVITGFSAGLAGTAGAGAAFAVLAALAGAGLHAGLLGGIVGKVVFRRLSNAGHRAFLIATIGLAIALGEAVRLAAGSRDRWIQPLFGDPLLLLDGGFRVTLTVMRLAETLGAAALLTLVLVAMHRSRFGLAWRATADDPQMARFLGLDTDRIATATFVLSAALAGLAGAMTALHYGQASYGAGTMIGLKALVAALLGGIGSLPGAALGGLAIGLGETLWSAYLPIENRDIAILTALVLVLMFRPHGLLGIDRQLGDAADRRWNAGG